MLKMTFCRHGLAGHGARRHFIIKKVWFLWERLPAVAAEAAMAESASASMIVRLRRRKPLPPKKKSTYLEGGAFLLAVLLAVTAPSVSLAAVEVLTLRYRSPSEVLPLVKPLLSIDGKISADDRTNQLIIVDSEEAIARVKRTLALVDQVAPQATIRVRFHETGEREDRSISGGGRVSGGNWSVSTGRGLRGRDGVDVRVQDRNISRGGSSEYFINTLSGNWAYIRVGQDVPYSAYWVDLCRRHGRTVAYRRIETGFDVKPVIRETLAEVEIVPRISEMGSSGSSGVVQFAEAATRIHAPLGQWMIIGGSDQSTSEVVRAILEAGSSRQSSALSIQLMVEAR